MNLSGNEYILGEETLITSKTDCKGRILYCNQDFILYSGYKEEELLQKPHNIIRHPDMPRSVFKLLWEGIQSGQEVFAFVKNSTKNGGFYWTFTNVTPSLNMKREIIGYYSVRRKPSLQALEVIKPLYQEISNVEKKEGLKEGYQFLQNKISLFKKPYNHVIYELQSKGSI